MKKICILLFILFFCVSCTNREDKLIMVTEASFAPYEYYSDGEITGVDVEIAKKIADSLDRRLVIKAITWDGLIADLMQSWDVKYLIRGLRNTMDYNYEENIAEVLGKDIEE